MKNLIVSESQNDITGFHKISVLSLVACPDTWTIMPVHTVALNDDRVLGELEIDHELIKHDNLFIEGDAVFSQNISHSALYVGATSCRKVIEQSKHTMLLATVFAAPVAGWEGFKLLAAVGADNGYLGLPVGIVRTVAGGKFTRRMEALFRAVQGALSDALAHIKLLAALLAGAGYLRCVFVSLFDTVMGIAALGGTELRFGVAAAISQKFLAALGARGRNAIDRYTFAAAKIVLYYLAIVFAECLAASLTSDIYLRVSGHKRNLLSDGWHVCLGHAAPTGGIHNYIKLGANHQVQRVLSNFIIPRMEACNNA